MLRYIIALTLSVASLQLSARTIGDFFGMAEADTAFPIIDATTRLDMLDYAHSGLTTPSNNRQSGVARIISINDTTLTLTPATGVYTSLSMLTSKSDTVLMVIETLPLPQYDSRITFYDTRWQPAKRAPLATPTLQDWFDTKDKQVIEAARNEIPFILCTASYDHATRILTLTNTLDKYFAPEDTPKSMTQMRTHLYYQLDDKLRFKRINDIQ